MNNNKLRTGIIERISDPIMAAKLYAMGILPGQRIEVVRSAPFGGTYYVKIGTQTIALRTSELNAIEIR